MILHLLDVSGAAACSPGDCRRNTLYGNASPERVSPHQAVPLHFLVTGSPVVQDERTAHSLASSLCLLRVFARPQLSMAATSLVASLTRLVSATPSTYSLLTTVVQTLRDLLSLRVIGSAFAVLITIRFMRTRTWLAGTGFFPGKWQIMSPLFPYPFLPEIPYVCMDPFWWMRLKHKRACVSEVVISGGDMFGG